MFVRQQREEEFDGGRGERREGREELVGAGCYEDCGEGGGWR